MKPKRLDQGQMVVEKLRFNVVRNAIYHTARRRALEGRSRWLSFLIIVGGAASIIDLIREYSTATQFIGAAIAALGALQLVFDFAGRARAHELLQRRFYELLGRIDETSNSSPRLIASLQGELARIYGEEPPTFRALDAIAYNEAADALYGDKEDRCPVSWWQSLTRNWLYHNNANFAAEKS